MPYVQVETAWGAPAKSEPISAQTNTPPSTVWASINGSRLTQVKARPEMSTTAIVDGWREPTVFRGYACRVSYPEPPDFFYEGRNTSNVKILHKGKHYLHNSNSLYCGCTGTAKYPIDIGQDAIARSECIANLDKADIQLGITLIEFGTTITMLSRALVNLHKYLSSALRFLKRRAVRKSHVDRILRLSATSAGRREIVKYLGRAAANRWLEYQYGWRSLMSDIYGLQSSIELQAAKTHRITGKSRYETGTNPSYPFTPPTGGELFAIGGVRAGAYCRMDWEIENAVARTYNRLGLLNPLELAWEAIPFSFVVDWVLPIGNYLSALAGGWGLTYKGGSITRYSTADYHVYWTQYRFERGTRVQYYLKSVSWFRYPISDTSGRLYVTNPLKSVSRAATALALFTQLSKG